MNPSLDRFAYGLPDSQDKPLDFVAYCACGCGARIFFGDCGVWVYDGDYFVTAEHFARWSGAKMAEHEWS